MTFICFNFLLCFNTMLKLLCKSVMCPDKLIPSCYNLVIAFMSGVISPSCILAVYVYMPTSGFCLFVHRLHM